MLLTSSRLTFIFLLLISSCVTLAQNDSIWNYLEEIEGTEEWKEHVKFKGVQFLNGDVDKLVPLAKKAEQIAERDEDDILLAASHNMRGLWYNQMGQLDSALIEYRTALSYLRGSEELGLTARSYSYSANSQYYKGNLHLQAAYSDSAYALADSVGDTPLKRNLSFNRAFLMTALGKPEETERILHDLYEELNNDEEKDELFIAQVALNLGQNYRTAQADTAIYYTTIARDIASRLNVMWIVAQADGQLASYLLYQGKDSEAKIYLEEAQSIYAGMPDPYGEMMMLVNFAKYHRNRGDYDLSLEYGDSAVALSTSSGFQIWMRESYELVAEVAELNADYEKALDAYQKFKAVSDSIEGSEIRSQVAYVELKYQSAEKEAELAELKAQKELDDREAWIVYISGGAIIVLGLFFFFSMRNRTRARQKISEKERQRLKAEVARAELEETNLRKEVNLKNQQLTAKALHLSQRNQLLENLLDKIDKAKEDDLPVDKLLPSLVREIKLSLQSDSEWNEFRKYFEELNQDFFEKAKELAPEVTEKELRLLALTKIGLTIKEIAHLMHVAPNSVKTARYRLKKKLDLEEEKSLEEFVEQM